MGEELAELGEKIIDWTQPGNEGAAYAKILTCKCGQKIKVLPSVAAVRCVACVMKEADQFWADWEKSPNRMINR